MIKKEKESVDIEKEIRSLKFIIIMFTILLLTFAGFYFYEKMLNIDGKCNDEEINHNHNTIESTDNTTNSEKDTEDNSVSLDTESLLDKISGVYSICEKSNDNLCIGNVLSINNESDGKITSGKLHSGGGIYGEIDEITYIEENKYKISFFRLKDSEDKKDNIDYISEDKHYEITINISKLDKHKLIISDFYDLSYDTDIYGGKEFELEYIGKGKCALDKYLSSNENYDSSCVE